MRREALQQLLKDGYTINQISEAMKDDVFSILPKTITEIVNDKNKNKRAVKKVVNAVQKQEKVTITRKENKAEIGDAGSISVTEDSKDL